MRGVNYRPEHTVCGKYGACRDNLSRTATNLSRTATNPSYSLLGAVGIPVIQTAHQLTLIAVDDYTGTGSSLTFDGD